MAWAHKYRQKRLKMKCQRGNCTIDMIEEKLSKSNNKIRGFK